MLLLEINKAFELAIQSHNIKASEKILQDSDCLDHLIKQYCKNNTPEQFIEISQQFRSKGLKIRVQSVLLKYKDLCTHNKAKKHEKVILTHQGNKLNNEQTHLSSNTY